MQEIRGAYQNVPYYRETFNHAGVEINTIRHIEDLKQLPFITKDEVREQFPDNIVARGYDIDKCHYSATTGSTGRSLPFVFSPGTYAFYLSTSLRVYTMIGYRPWHKLVYLKYTAVKTPGFSGFFEQAHISSVISIEEQIARLREEKPDLLVGYASLILEVAQRVTAADLEYIQPKFISVNSELSSRDQRDFIASVFRCPVYDEYSTEETWMVASQCREYNYHIFTDNVWVEFLDDEGNEVPPGETGEMVLTTMRSPVMPFIRYRIGDLGRLSTQSCSCGIGFPLLEAFEGRADDSFILPSGKSVPSLKILNTFTIFIKRYLHLMEEFKVVQKETNLITILLVEGREFKKEHFDELIDKLHHLLSEPVTIEVEMVDRIDNHGSIKRKAIESWVAR